MYVNGTNNTDTGTIGASNVVGQVLNLGATISDYTKTPVNIYENVTGAGGFNAVKAVVDANSSAYEVVGFVSILNGNSGLAGPEFRNFKSSNSVYPGQSVNEISDFYATDVWTYSGAGHVHNQYGLHVTALGSNGNIDNSTGVFFDNNPNGGSLASAPATDISIMPGSGQVVIAGQVILTNGLTTISGGITNLSTQPIVSLGGFTGNGGGLTNLNFTGTNLYGSGADYSITSNMTNIVFGATNISSYVPAGDYVISAFAVLMISASNQNDYRQAQIYSSDGQILSTWWEHSASFSAGDGIPITLSCGFAHFSAPVTIYVQVKNNNGRDTINGAEFLSKLSIIKTP